MWTGCFSASGRALFLSCRLAGTTSVSSLSESSRPARWPTCTRSTTLTSHKNFRAGMHGKDAAKPWMAHLHRFRPSPIPHTRVFRSAVLGHRNRPVETMHSPYTHPRTTKQPQSNNLNKTRKTKKTVYIPIVYTQPLCSPYIPTLALSKSGFGSKQSSLISAYFCKHPVVLLPIF